MKRVVGALFILSAAFCGKHALAEGAGSTPPPTAQFPSTEPAPANTQKAQAPPAASEAPGAPSAAPPPVTAAPPPPPGTAPPAAQGGYPPYPYPPSYPYAPPELVPTTAPATDSDEVVTISISPLHLIFPIVQLTGEVRATPHFGISVIAGYGSVPVDTTNTNSITGTSSVKFTAYEIGGRLIGYPLKKFKSLQLGGQLMYLKVDTNGPLPDSNISETGAGVAFGPFVGYKLVTSVGFTFLAQFGVQYLSAQAEAHDTNGVSSSESNNRFLLLLNLDIGWSF
jgi:hypothetical protein